ncbi:MAG: hypothetical protein BM555_05945 [Crocinitomix sp. MedPE-SWsnd]|nr:MAG: hypothetical protein BM555_05945 [Crocinitomix sp. MedPE-SWsnd]
MKKSNVISRIILVLALLAIFGYLALTIFNIQSSKLSLLSFKIEENAQTVVISDADRLIGKIENASEVKIDGYPELLKSGIDFVLKQDSVDFNSIVSRELAISFNESDFAITYEDGVSFSALASFISSELNVESSFSADKLVVGGHSFIAHEFGDFKCISSQNITPSEATDSIEYGSADYIVFNQSSPSGVRHMVSKDYHFTLTEDATASLKGKVINSEEYFKVAPGKFDALEFYGSSRFEEDAGILLSPEAVDVMDWVQDGILLVQFGEYEMIIGREKPEASLSFILEEQTLDSQPDSVGINEFNIGSYKIQSYTSSADWSSVIPSLKTNLSYYTELNDFVILSNNIPAMRWYLGEFQLGNLFEQNLSDYRLYEDCLPNASHFIQMLKNEEAVNCESHTYQKNGMKLITGVETNKLDIQSENVELLVDFSIQISPTDILIDEDKILLSNSTAISVYKTEGELIWSKNLEATLISKPQIVDFENDGVNEYVLFQKNKLDVVNSLGKSLNGFPITLSGNCKAGLAVNYDNMFNYRLIVNEGNAVKVYNESGKIVEGWMFEGMNAPIKSEIYHVLTSGKDIIAFKDENKQQYILNRRGESRLSDQVSFQLPNETDFVVGGMESSLRKMGYSNGYIYNYYVLDGQKDSVKIDKYIQPIDVSWEYNSGSPLMIVEETERLLIVDQHGYIKSEVLKPQQTNKFVGLVGTKDYGFVFSDNSQNSIYLLNNFGKMMLPNAVQGSSVCSISGDVLYTYSGINIKAYKIIN